MLQEAQGLCRKHRRAVHVRARLFQRSRCSSLQPTSHTPTRCNCRKTHLAFITKLNVCLALRCDCLRDGDTDGVTVDNMQTLRKPLEKCLLGTCPVFPCASRPPPPRVPALHFCDIGRQLPSPGVFL